MPNNTLFLTLRVFSATGGIEKVCRLIGKALYELGLQYGGTAQVYSMYCKRDAARDNKYFPDLMFSGFGCNKFVFAVKSVLQGRRSKTVILSHINLLLVGFLIKLMKPSVKLVLITHGIEVWEPFSGWKKYMLSKYDLILPVSHYTRDRMLALHGVGEEKYSVFNNCLEPFLQLPLQPGRNAALIERYCINSSQPVMLTVSRMADSEQYKGYNKVLACLPTLLSRFPDLRYLIVGKYDVLEKQRLDKLIKELGIEQAVIFSGFVADEEMPAHFGLANLFIMPSEKEGFGIVFIEAMFYGLPVIAGNKDGSVDALKNGELGILINPDKPEEITAAITKVLENPAACQPDRNLLFEQFSYTWYKRKLRCCLERVQG